MMIVDIEPVSFFISERRLRHICVRSTTSLPHVRSGAAAVVRVGIVPTPQLTTYFSLPLVIRSTPPPS